MAKIIICVWPFSDLIFSETGLSWEDYESKASSRDEFHDALSEAVSFLIKPSFGHLSFTFTAVGANDIGVLKPKYGYFIFEALLSQ